MPEFRCACGYFLCSTELTKGEVRVVCRRCKKSQRVDFSTPSLPLPRPPSHLKAAGLT